MAVSCGRFLMMVAGAGLLLGGSGCQLWRGPAGPGGSTPRIASGADVIRAMHARYGGRWYETLAARQQNTRWTAAGREARSEWIEYVSVPGRLRIEFLPLTMRSGLLYEGGRVHTFDDGRRLETRRQLNPLLLLTADVYVLPPDSTLTLLRRLGVSLDQFHERSWEGRRVLVFGAAAGDTTRTQLWVDAQRLVVVRWIERERSGGRTTVTDTHLRRYRTVGGYPVAHETVVHRNGQRVLREEYLSVHINPELPAGLFLPARWGSVPRPAI